MANATQGQLTEHCEGCEKIVSNRCSIYINPEAQMRWVNNPKEGGVGCGFNIPNLIKRGILEDRRTGEDRRVRVGQQKQKKK